MAKRKIKRRQRQRRRKRGGRASKFRSTLMRLKKLNPSQRQQAISIANDKFIRDFSTQVKKLRCSKAIRPGLRQKLKQHGKVLRKLCSKRTSIKAKRKMLSQRGGVLPVLLAALPAIGSIAGAIISRL